MTYPARLEGQPVECEVGPDALFIGGTPFAYVDMDSVVVDGYAVRLIGPGREIRLEQLGRMRDEFVLALRKARLPARRHAMVQAGADDQIDAYDAFRGDEPVEIGLHSDGLTVESDAGTPDYLPLSCITNVQRDDYAITITARTLEPVIVSKLGRRTDEFLQDLDTARRDLAKKTAEAYAELSPALSGFAAPDGWAVTKAEAGRFWGALREAFAGQDRAKEIATLESICGDALRLGIKAQFQGRAMPFALAPAGGKVAVESADDEARATYVFATDDVERMNVVLLITSFRREALYLPEEQLGRWAVAARVLPSVRWARRALADRIVHDAAWEKKLRAAVSPPG